MQRSRPHGVGEVPADALDALLDQTSVGLDLGLAGAAQKPEAAALTLKMRPGAHEPALLVVEVRKFHLQSALAGECPLAEDLQDQAGSIEHLAVPRAFQIALLDGADGVIDNDEPRRVLGHPLRALLPLARPQTGGRSRPRQRHELGGTHIEGNGTGEPHSLLEPVRGGTGRCCRAIDSEPGAVARHALITPQRYKYDGTRRRASALDRTAAVASLRLGVRERR